MKIFNSNSVNILWFEFILCTVFYFMSVGTDQFESESEFLDNKPLDAPTHQFLSGSHASEVQKTLIYDGEPFWPMQWFMSEETIQVENYTYSPSMNIVEMHRDGIKGANCGVVIIGNTPVNSNHEEICERFMADSPSFSMHPKKSIIKSLYHQKFKTPQSIINSVPSEVAGIIGMSDRNQAGGVGVAPQCLLGHFTIEPTSRSGSPEYCIAKSISLKSRSVDVFVHVWILPFFDPLRNILRAWGDKNLLYFQDFNLQLKPQVMGSGNLGLFANTCQCNEYANADSMFVFGSIAYNKFLTRYSETCASLIGVTYSTSPGQEYYNNIVTISSKASNLYQYAAKGNTAISAAIGGGIIALLIDAYKRKVGEMPSFTDIAFLLAFSSTSDDLIDKNMLWFTNGAGLKYSPQAGFGAPNMVKALKLLNNWTPLGSPSIYVVSRYDRQINFGCLQNRQKRKSLTYFSSLECYFTIVNAQSHFFIQSVGLEITVSLSKRGALSIYLISPAGTVSCLLEGRPYDVRNKGYEKIYLRSNHFLGEKLEGKWCIKFFTYKEDSMPTYNEKFSFPTKFKPSVEATHADVPLSNNAEALESESKFVKQDSLPKVLNMDEDPDHTLENFSSSKEETANNHMFDKDREVPDDDFNTWDTFSRSPSVVIDSSDSETSVDFQIKSPKTIYQKSPNNERNLSNHEQILLNNSNNPYCDKKPSISTIPSPDSKHASSNKSQRVGQVALNTQKKKPLKMIKKVTTTLVKKVKFRALLIESLPTSLTLMHEPKSTKKSELDFIVLKSWVDYRHFLLIQTDPINYGTSSVTSSELYGLMNFFIRDLLIKQKEEENKDLTNTKSSYLYKFINEIQSSSSPISFTNAEISSNLPSRTIQDSKVLKSSSGNVICPIVLEPEHLDHTTSAESNIYEENHI